MWYTLFNITVKKPSETLIGVAKNLIPPINKVKEIKLKAKYKLISKIVKTKNKYSASFKDASNKNPQGFFCGS